jgi:DNA-dependent RNA polymerase auxiliary subunit epsilon
MYNDLIKAIDVILKSEDDDLSDLLASEGFSDTAYTVEQINALEDKFAEALEKEREHFSNDGNSPSLNDYINHVKQDLMASDTFAAAIGLANKQVLEITLEQLTKTYMALLDKDVPFEMFTKATTNFINDWSEQLGEIMKLASHDRLQEILDIALENGDSVQDVIADLEDAYCFSRLRARRTAITEMLRAHSYAKNEAFTQSPVVTKVQWKHSGGKGINPRKHHEALDGTTIKKNGKFTIYAPSGTFKAMFPRDTNLPASETVECHCTHSAVVDEDILGLSKEEKIKLRDEAIAEADKLYG